MKSVGLAGRFRSDHSLAAAGATVAKSLKPGRMRLPLQ